MLEDRKPWQRRTVFGTGIMGAIMAALIGLDQFGNALTGGDPDMTISTRCGLELKLREKPSMGCRVVCWGLNLIDTDHCVEARE